MPMRILALGLLYIRKRINKSQNIIRPHKEVAMKNKIKIIWVIPALILLGSASVLVGTNKNEHKKVLVQKYPHESIFALGNGQLILEEQIPSQAENDSLQKLEAASSAVEVITERIKEISKTRTSLYNKVKNLKKLNQDNSYAYGILDEINDLDEEKIALTDELIKNLKMVTENEN